MHKIITILLMMFLASNVLADDGIGVVEEIDVERGYIVISKVRYDIKHGKTKLVSGKNNVDLGLLKAGSIVTFTLDDSLITEITYTSPIQEKS